MNDHASNEHDGRRPDDLPLADAGVRRGDGGTSREAAEHLERSGAVTRLILCVWRTLERHGGEGTSEEIADWSGIDLQSVTPRLAPMVRRGLVYDTGRTRPGRSGSQRIVWGLRRPQSSTEEISATVVVTRQAL